MADERRQQEVVDRLTFLREPAARQAQVAAVAANRPEVVRGGEEQPAAGAQNPRQLAHRGARVRNVLDRFAADHRIHGIAGEGNRLRVSLHEADASRLR